MKKLYTVALLCALALAAAFAPSTRAALTPDGTAAAMGRLQPEDPLPSVRQLAPLP